MVGKDLLIAMGGRVIAAQRTCNLNIQQDTIEVCSPVSGPWREYIPSTLGWTVSCDGLIYAPEYADELMEVLISRQKVRLSYYDPELRIVRSGYAIPTGLQQGASISSLATYALTFQGSGELGEVPYEDVTIDFRYTSVHDVDFKNNVNHPLVANGGADMLVNVCEINSVCRVHIKASSIATGGIASIIPLPYDKETEILEGVIESCDNLRFFNMEIAHIGDSALGLKQEVDMMMQPGRYAFLMEGHAQMHLDVRAISLPVD